MAVEKISIETLRDELKDKKVQLTLDSESINNILSPMDCVLCFDGLNINIIHPASMCLYSDKSCVKLSQINYIYKQNNDGIISYVLNCGNFAQMNTDFILECL